VKMKLSLGIIGLSSDVSRQSLLQFLMQLRTVNCGEELKRSKAMAPLYTTKRCAAPTAGKEEGTHQLSKLLQ
jgi:hypothetical protein